MPDTYTYQTSPFDGQGFIMRSSGNVSDEACIPLTLDNRDYQGFLAWIADGNTAPEGWTGPTNQSG